MKNLNFLFVIIFTVFLSGFANKSSAQLYQWNFGLEGGVGFRSLNGSDQLDLNTKAGFGYIAGIFGQYNINSNYSIKLAANYQRKGAKIEVNTPTDTIPSEITINGEINLDMITIPVLFKGSWGTKIKFFANVGPYLGFVLKHEVIVDPGSTFDTAGSTTDITDSTKSTEFGISAGIGLAIPISTTALLTFEIRDDIGLTNLSDFLSDVSGDNLKTNSANFIVGVSFGTGKKVGRKPVY